MANSISNSDDIIDSRDVIARIDELEQERQELEDTLAEAESAFADTSTDDDEIVQNLQDTLDSAKQALDDWNLDNADELKSLKDLAEEADGSGDWQHGETLIRESYFEDYARELAEDIGAISGSESWPLDCIDWEKAANELQMDYTSVEFDGVTYYIRS